MYRQVTYHRSTNQLPQSAYCPPDVPGCYTVNHNPDPRALASELAKIELTESTFLLCAVVLAFLVWVGGQIGKTENLKVEAEYGGKKKKSSSSSGTSAGSLSKPSTSES